MTEKDEILRVSKELQNFTSDAEPRIHRSRGMLDERKQEGINIDINDALLTAWRMDVSVRKQLKTLMDNLTTWIDRIEAQNKDNRESMLKLLGLMPDATSQEVIEAIDDIAPIIAGYRKKKRGV